MGLRGEAAIVGAAQYKPLKYNEAPQMLHLEQVADLTTQALADAGIGLEELDGLVVNSAHFNEAHTFIPAMVGEYLGVQLNFGEVIDLGGTSSVGAVWRAAAAIELGLCNTVVCVLPGRFAPPSPRGVDMAVLARQLKLGGHSDAYGAPEAEMDLPYGHMGQNTGYAMIAERYRSRYEYDPAVVARICVDQRFNACHNPDAIFYGQPLTVEDVLASRMVAEPLRVLEIVMPVAGGAAVVVTRRDRAKSCNHRPVRITGCGEHIQSKSPTYARDIIETPIGKASRKAFEMAGRKPSEMHMAQIYDCYTITVMLTLEDAGFCAKGEGMKFLREHDFTFKGDFPMNTHGGQLSFGQSGQAGGMSQVIEAVHQLQGRAGERQLPRHDLAYVSGTGGVMSEQGALILEGEG